MVRGVILICSSVTKEELQCLVVMHLRRSLIAYIGHLKKHLGQANVRSVDLVSMMQRKRHLHVTVIMYDCFLVPNMRKSVKTVASAHQNQKRLQRAEHHSSRKRKPACLHHDEAIIAVPIINDLGKEGIIDFRESECPLI